MYVDVNCNAGVGIREQSELSLGEIDIIDCISERRIHVYFNSTCTCSDERHHATLHCQTHHTETQTFLVQYWQSVNSQITFQQFRFF